MREFCKSRKFAGVFLEFFQNPESQGYFVLKQDAVGCKIYANKIFLDLKRWLA
jgi:hypothetical protein